MAQAIEAIRYLQRAWQLARRRPLLPWVVVPMAFNLVLFGALYYLTGSALAGWIDAATAGWAFTGFWDFLNPLLDFLLGAAVVLLWVLLLVVLASVFTIAVQLVAAPFMGLLAEQVDRQTSAIPLPAESFGRMLRRTVTREIRKTWDWLWRTLAVLLIVAALWLIPGVNVLASVVWFLWSGWLLGIQYIDYGADNRQVSFNAMKRRAAQRPWLVLSFGCVVLGLTLLPLVNLVIMPVAVIAGTLIWLEGLDGKDVDRAAG